VNASPPLFQLVTRRKHVLADYQTVPPSRSISGLEQWERTCALCKAVKITLLPGGERLWRRAGETAQAREEPVCEVMGEGVS
jgi:hypothetical protein